MQSNQVFEVLDKDFTLPKNNLVVNETVEKKLLLKDMPMCVMLKDSSGKIEPFYLAYNVYSLNNKHKVVFSRSMKFRKEIYYQILQQVIVDIYTTKNYNYINESLFLSDVSMAFRYSNYKLFKLVPVWYALNKEFCNNSRIMMATIGEYNYFACNFTVCKMNPKRRTDFLIWREDRLS